MKKLLKGEIPNHLAIILDGNGRWAKKWGMPRTYGHKKGAENIFKIASLCDKLGIKMLTVYAFSTENFKRPKEEVDYLMNLPKLLEEENKDRFTNHNIVVRQVGRKEKIPKSLKNMFDNLYEKTKDHTGLQLNIAFDYGSYYELDDAIKRMIKDNKKSFHSKDIYPYLFVSEPVDLLIRTSGEQRLSNFLLYQVSYAELYFTKKHWPAFDKKELFKAIKEYQRRNRRFGGL
ncbi:MAG: di-trans,poly-cis-decaprenylcistransferase [Acholeplasmataceae bacterium]|jgi:undecaprenyl diphosphate synthase|nr:di-trans,poly-cis-decaprenylcistransferase [Acholeplasmataceae bacterium]